MSVPTGKLRTAENRPQVTTNCISVTILCPVAAGVGIIVRDASGTGGMTVDLDGGNSQPEAGQKKTLPGRV
jgi:hypothetical protein